MKKITISEEDFDDAVIKTMRDVENKMNDDRAKVLIPLTGAAFSSILRKHLFGKEDENGNSDETQTEE